MGNGNPSNQVELDKQVSTGIPNPTGKGGFQDHPELINRDGRPKRKTLTELIHAKLDETPGAWDAIVNTVIQKVIKDKEKEIIRTFWQYTDGMPKQELKHDGDITVTIKDYGANNNPPAETAGSTK